MIALAEDPQMRPSEEAQRQMMETLERFLQENPLELDEDQRENARNMLQRFMKDVGNGHHPVLATLLVDSKRGDQIAEDLVSAISLEVTGMNADSDHISTSMMHHLHEPDQFQRSAVETPAEALQRKLRSKGIDTEKEKGLMNYIELEDIEKKESKGHLPEGSAVTFLHRLKQSQASIRVPGVHVRQLIEDVMHNLHLDHLRIPGMHNPF